MTPPRLPRALLRLLLPTADRDVVLNDLDEEFARHVAPSRSAFRARAWYWRQAVKSLPFAIRLRRGSDGSTRGLGRAVVQATLADVRFAARIHRKQPLLTLAATATLGIGIAVTTAVLSIAHAVLLRPLPYAEPDRLVHLGEFDLDVVAAGRAASGNLSWPDFLDYSSQQSTFVALAGYSGGNRTLTGEGPADRLPMAEVTGDLFAVLGVRPQLGRLLGPDDVRPGAQPVVVLTDGVWRRRFGASSSVVGRPIQLSGQLTTVVGVLPQDFQFPLRGQAELWLPIRPSTAQLDRRFFHWP